MSSISTSSSWLLNRAKNTLLSFVPKNINIIIELSTPFVIDEQRTVTKHTFNIDTFNKLMDTKPQLVQNIINSGLASVKVAKENNICYTANQGVSIQDTLEFIAQYSLYESVEELNIMLNQSSIN